tara:strand:- start:450 stop:1862 length:1413 start_codon:yes stop_codon:yes gene_type:complete
MKKPVVRFAPSPTGYLHIGGARTALFNWLFARQNNGKFLLRIEDTDLERSKIEYVDQIKNALNWLGMDWDDDIIFQSKNNSNHQKVINELIQSGDAYKCFLTKEELDNLRIQADKNKEVFRVPRTYRDTSEEKQNELIDEGRSYTIRLKVPEGITKFKDLVFGEIIVDNKDLDDFIISRSDGSPTYNFVVAIDDIAMDISHIIRGDDHIANTPKQILVYNALKKNVPIFAHLPMILGSDKKRLSKRHAATNVQEYRDKGFTSDSIINYLSLLGWNPDSNDEIFNINELIKLFNFKQVQKKSAVFDEKKLLWISGQKMKEMTSKDILKEILLIDKAWGKDHNNSYLESVISLTKDRSKNLIDIIDISDIFLINEVNYSDEFKSIMSDQNGTMIIKDFLNAVKIEESWDKQTVEKVFEQIMNQHDIGLGKVMKPLRIAISGISYGPGIFDMMILLGKDLTINRIINAINFYK